MVATRAEPLGIEVVVGDPSADLSPADTFGVLLQHPGTSGVVRDLRPVIEAVHAAGGLAVVATDLLACTLLVPPGELGADAAVGSTQRFGVPHGLRRPARRLPGHPRRLPAIAARPAGGRVGRRRRASRAPAGPADPRAAHPAREGHVQHLHRPGAAGRDGVDVRRLPRARGAARRSPSGCTCRRPQRRRTLRCGGLRARQRQLVRHPDRARARARRPRSSSGLGRRASTSAAWTATRWASPSTRPRPRPCHSSWRPSGWPTASSPATTGSPTRERRRSEFLTHPVFHEHRCETEMLRYLRRLADKDVALDRAMIPLGSCTMKLNATTEMEPVTWPEFADDPPVRPPRPGRGLPGADPRARGDARRDHRLRRRVAAAQRRLAGRAGRPARHPRLPPQPRRRPA